MPDDLLLQKLRAYIAANYTGDNIVGDIGGAVAGFIGVLKKARPKMDSLVPTTGSANDNSSLLAKSILEKLRGLYEETFSEMVMRLMEKRGLKPADVCRMAGLTKSHLSKIKADRDYQPSKETALAFAVILRLTLDETSDLLKRAGYSISHSRKRDLVVEYFIKEGIYDADKLNDSLYELGLSPLTNRRRMNGEE